MIEVWISGRARRAVIDDGQDVRVLRYGAPADFEPCSPRQIDALRDAGAAELRALDVPPDPRTLYAELASAVAAAHACSGLEALLDAGFSNGVRRAMAEALETLFEDTATARAASAFLHEAPLPFVPDTPGALELCEQAHATRLAALLAQYDERLTVLRAAWDAWNELAGEMELGPQARRWFAASGGFAALAADIREPPQRGFGQWLVSQVASAPAEMGPAARVLKRLETLVRQRLARYDWPVAAAVQIVAEADEHYGHDAAPTLSRNPLESVQAQIAGILDALRRGKEERADSFVDELCDYQRRSGDVVYLAKSLCNLAQQASAVGRDDYAERLLQRAVTEAPGDGWTWQQLSTAYRRCGKLAEAEVAAERALQFDPTVVARTGRAEVLKAQGRYGEALEAYDEATRLFPGDVVARTGRAEVLKAQGRYGEALEAYDEATRLFPESAFTRIGRAYLLVLMQRLTEALASLPSGRPLTQQDWIAFHIRGMAHLRAGSLGDAQRLFEVGVRECPAAVQRDAFRRALAVTLIHQRRYEEAASQIEVQSAWGDVVLKAGSNLLAAHAWGGAGRREQARARFEPVASLELPLVARLRDALGERYELSSQPPLWPTPADMLDQIIEEEEFRLLAAA
jgi:tetratricopeptide (TPR) repeat protein